MAMKLSMRRVRNAIIQYLRGKTRMVIVITVNTNVHSDWAECRTLQWGRGTLDEAFHEHLYTTQVGKWLLEHPWHSVTGIGTVSIMDFDEVIFSTLQFTFLKKSDAALFKLTFPV
jgi:hypothetical protein